MLRILGTIVTSTITFGGVYLTIQKHRSLTIKDLLEGEGKVILGEEHGSEWEEKAKMGEVSVVNLKDKCRELLDILLVKRESLLGELWARR